ncbi:MAG: phosphohistidine phosphatase SixA, partial [Nitrososphaeraceae archaeon]
MDCYFLRHGFAGKKLSNINKDYNRNLTSYGKKEIAKIAKSLKTLDIKINYIFTSPLPRAYQTSTIIAREHNLENKIEILDSLKPGGKKIDLYNTISNLKITSSVLIIGHEPYLTDMISDIISISESSNDSSKKSDTKKININLKKAGLSK